MKRYKFIELDKDGNIIYERETDKPWFISLLQIFILSANQRLSHGITKHIVISEVMNGE